MNKTTLYGAVILGTLAAFVYFYESPERILGTSRALDSEVDAIPFAVAQGTTTTHFNNEGSISYTFNAERLEHYRDTDSAQVFTLVEAPHLIIYQDEQPWFVRARKGKIFAVDQRIELWQQVVVEHTSEQGITTHIHTEKLDIDPINRLAKTEEPVRISSEKVEIRGTGMNADLNAQQLRLLSEVQGHYDPS